MIITMADIRKCHMCRKGTRKFFARHNIAWMPFLKNGIEAQELLDTGDAMAIKVVQEARNGRKQ